MYKGQPKKISKTTKKVGKQKQYSCEWNPTSTNDDKNKVNIMLEKTKRNIRNKSWKTLKREKSLQYHRENLQRQMHTMTLICRKTLKVYLGDSYLNMRKFIFLQVKVYQQQRVTPYMTMIYDTKLYTLFITSEGLFRPWQSVTWRFIENSCHKTL